MKKRILSIVLAFAMLLGIFLVPSYAASSFTDITDSATANAVEVLRFMGVIDGVGDGKYNPKGTLTRAEFAKLAVVSMNSAADLTKYKNMTIFPDVKAGQWCAPYVNMAAKGLSIIAGSTDGYFHPDKTISIGEAITIILRLIGFKDEQVGGVWPYGHFDFANDLGLLAGMNVTTATGSITRADAAKLFVNAINVDSANNKAVFHLSSETILISANSGTKKMKTSSGEYNMVKSVTANSLVGKAGYVVLDKNGSALTFIPKSAVSYGYTTAIVIKSAGDASQLTALAGRSDYTIYRNGSLITKDKLRTGDVAVYDKEDNKVIVCDTKLPVYYEACEGSAAEPVSITALGREFTVLPCAIESLRSYKPGSRISLSLTASGEIAAATGTTFSSSTNNAVFIVTPSGKANLICGSDIFDYGLSVSDKALYGKAAYISNAEAGKITFTALENTEKQKLDVANKKLGTKNIADNALVFENGNLTTLSQLTTTNVIYSRVNVNGEVDLIVCFSLTEGSLVIGYATYGKRYVDGGYGIDGYYEDAFLLTGPNNFSEYFTDYSSNTENGFFIVNYAQGTLNNPRRLKASPYVTKTAFNGTSTVNINGKEYSIYENAICYNKYTKDYDTSFEEALALGTSFTLYYYDDVVYLISYQY